MIWLGKMRIHIEAVGGLAGDMFIAAMVDAEPESAHELDNVLCALAAPTEVRVRAEPTNNGQMVGHRFSVAAPARGHAHYPDIVRLIEGSTIKQAVKARALDIFAILAHAEAKVHGVELDKVNFHEVGNWDSIIDVVFAAHLIERCSDAHWTTGPLPLGEGFVDCDHGRIPLPTPAALEMLKGFPVYRDGIKGERITPTGAAILRHLTPTYGQDTGTMVVSRSGVGFGTREFAEISNVVRLLFSDEAFVGPEADRVGVIRFSVDDQTPEDLAIALDQIRIADGALDVMQMPAFGKKGRMLSRIEVVCQPEYISDIVQTCFQQTSTIGLRWGFESRAVLSREEAIVIHDGERWNAKIATRPDGIKTAKVEADDLAEHSHTRSERDRLRQTIEKEAQTGRDETKIERRDEDD